MKISIAMATFNGAEYLREQLDSINAQTHLPDELVVTDDGSTDETIDILQKFAEESRFEVKIYSNLRRLGYAGNFNRALQLCQGDLVFLSDQDDAWFRDKIELMVKRAWESRHNFVVMCDAELTDGELNPCGITKLEQIKAAGLPVSSFVMGCCVCVKAEFLAQILPIAADYPAHDNWIVRISNGLSRTLILEKPLQYYRRHSKNESDFIANRTRRISRTQYIFDYLQKKSRSYKAEKGRLAEEIKAEQLLSCGVKRAAERCHVDDSEAFDKLAQHIDSKIHILRTRFEIRKCPLPVRLFRATKFWLRRGYDRCDGWKSAVGDIIYGSG
jgi:glycosyltransferase involved in cell wall biosynthesis